MSKIENVNILEYGKGVILLLLAITFNISSFCKTSSSIFVLNYALYVILFLSRQLIIYFVNNEFYVYQ